MEFPLILVVGTPIGLWILLLARGVPMRRASAPAVLTLLGGSALALIMLGSQEALVSGYGFEPTQASIAVVVIGLVVVGVALVVAFRLGVLTERGMS